MKVLVRPRRALLAVVALLAVLALDGTASASNSYAGNGVFFANSNFLDFYYHEASQFTIDSTRWERENVYDPT